MDLFFRKCRILFAVIILNISSSAFASFLVVTPEQISVTPNGLFVTIDSIPIGIASLNVANNGYFVAIPLPSPYADICPKCGHDTYTPGRTCSNCGFPIWDDEKKLQQS